MNDDSTSSSSDDDCSYTNAAAKFKAFRDKKYNYTSPDEEDETSNYFDFPVNSNKPNKKKEEQPNTPSKVPKLSEKSPKKNSPNKRQRKSHSPNPPSPIYEVVDSISLDTTHNDQDQSLCAMQISNLSNLSDSAVLIGSDPEDNGESENYTMDVKVHWRSKDLTRLSIRRYESFAKIYQHFADLEKVPIGQILIYKKEKVISHTDTPVSIELSVIDILEGGVIDADRAKQEKLEASGDGDENICKIKVQTSDSKQSVLVNLKMDENFHTVILTCVEQLGVPQSSVKLYFDGELIGPNDTPESLDLEQEACIDLRIVKS